MAHTVKGLVNTSAAHRTQDQTTREVGLMKAKFSERDTRGHLFVDCSECDRGGNGTATDKCSSGWRHKKGRNGGCFMGTLLKNLEVA